MEFIYLFNYLFIYLMRTWQMIFDLKMLKFELHGSIHYCVKYLFYILCDKAQAKKRIFLLFDLINLHVLDYHHGVGFSLTLIFNRCPEDVEAVYRHT